MTPLLVVRAAEFQGALYYSLLLFVILFLVLLGIGYALVGVRGLWRSGERGPATVLGGALTVAFLALVGMYVVAVGGLFAAPGLGT
ncbi:MAG TPA: hypothetical protein VIN65_09490 [Candidatus Dormibacteraeota bacterium]